MTGLGTELGNEKWDAGLGMKEDGWGDSAQGMSEDAALKNERWDAVLVNKRWDSVQVNERKDAALGNERLDDSTSE